MHLPYSSWDRPVPKEGGWGSREVWRDLAKSAQRLQHQPEGEVRGGLEKRDQEIAKAERSGSLETIGFPIPCFNNFPQLDQNMARLWRNQGQVHPDGESQVDRNGSLKKTNQLCWECQFSKALFPQQMERFKIVERETKTKAYSKEVLKCVYFFLTVDYIVSY